MKASKEGVLARRRSWKLVIKDPPEAPAIQNGLIFSFENRACITRVPGSEDEWQACVIRGQLTNETINTWIGMRSASDCI